MTEQIPDPKLGLTVHVIGGPKGECAAGIVVHVDGTAKVLAQIVFFAPKGTQLSKPIGWNRVPQIVRVQDKEGNQELSWHLPGECPWNR